MEQVGRCRKWNQLNGNGNRAGSYPSYYRVFTLSQHLAISIQLCACKRRSRARNRGLGLEIYNGDDPVLVDFEALGLLPFFLIDKKKQIRWEHQKKKKKKWKGKRPTLLLAAYLVIFWNSILAMIRKKQRPKQQHIHKKPVWIKQAE